MGLFGSSSNSTPTPEQTIPTRSARQECWNSRDGYYACLTSKSIIVPPGTDMAEGRAPGGGLKQTAEDKQREKEKQQRLQKDRENDPCNKERDLYEGHCAKSWIDYFNKRRVLEERQRLMYAQGKAPLGSGPAPGNRT